MAFEFSLQKESIKRKICVYVVVAKYNKEIKLYVGKTGDNRKGCNPLISRCGNHFSYNEGHSQVRSKLKQHELYDYKYIFDHFFDYDNNQCSLSEKVNRINEIERWLNESVQNLLVSLKMQADCLLNPFLGAGHVKEAEKERRAAYRTVEYHNKINLIIEMTRNNITQ